MKKFKEVFLDESKQEKINQIDKLKNFINFIIMGYYYLRHKIYTHYYNIIESKF